MKQQDGRRVTEWIEPHTKFPTQWGNLSGEQWLKREAERMARADGFFYRTERRTFLWKSKGKDRCEQERVALVRYRHDPDDKRYHSPVSAADTLGTGKRGYSKAGRVTPALRREGRTGKMRA